MLHWMIKKVGGVVLALALFVCLHGQALAGQKNIDLEKIGKRNINAGQVNFYSFEKEIALGKQLSLEVEQTNRILDDPEITEYINRLGQNIVRNSDAQVPFVVKVIDSDEVNAFALPGGYFYVNTGLIMATQEESELAGVMAHEVAHVAARHATEQFSKGRLINLASVPLIFVGGPVGLGIQQAITLLIPLQFLQFSRGSEREADFLGLQYMYKTGYDPQSFISFFEKVAAQEKRKPGFLSRAFSSHPMTKERISRAQKEIQELIPVRDQYVINTSEFDHIRARLKARDNAAGPDPESDNIRPKLNRKAPSSEESSGDELTPVDETPRLTRNP
ncbi:MAG: M48 family metallopeptidase [Terriglobia bacterium]